MISLSAYARRRGVSVEAVSKAVRAGRLSKSISIVGGAPKIADPEAADSEWTQNTRPRVEYWKGSQDDLAARREEQHQRRLEQVAAKKRQRESFADLDAIIARAMRAWRPPARLLPVSQLAGKSRYERRVTGATIEEIAAQDGVSASAVIGTIAEYGRRTGLPPTPTPRVGDEALVTGATLARILGMSPDQVARLKSKGVLVGVQDGRTVRYAVEEARRAVERELAEREAKAAARSTATELTCFDCKRTLPRDHFPIVTRRDKRCKPGYERTGPSYDCRDCRQVRKRATDARRRMVIDAAVEPVSHLVVAKRDGWLCAICRGRVTRQNWSLDHVVPLSKGGAHTYANVVLAHVSCNVKRGAGRFPVQAPLFALPPDKATCVP